MEVGRRVRFVELFDQRAEQRQHVNAVPNVPDHSEKVEEKHTVTHSLTRVSSRYHEGMQIRQGQEHVHCDATPRQHEPDAES